MLGGGGDFNLRMTEALYSESVGFAFWRSVTEPENARRSITALVEGVFREGWDRMFTVCAVVCVRNCIQNEKVTENILVGVADRICLRSYFDFAPGTAVEFER